MSKKYELRLCNDGNYYLYHKGVLINAPYISFDKFNKEDAESIIGELNHLSNENEQLKKENKFLRCTIESNNQDDYINYLKKQNEQLKQELFEARKDYIVDTADISDKPYLDEMIEEERKEIYGDVK